jgi:hypothetical protein
MIELDKSKDDNFFNNSQINNNNNYNNNNNNINFPSKEINVRKKILNNN